MNFFLNKPKNKITLFARAQALAGFTIGNLAANAGLEIPYNLKKDKGWIGRLIELYLGVDSKNKAEQDFAHLGIELKTIPIDSYGNPIEDTFVCSVPLINNIGITWETSNIQNKLSSILWIPIEGKKNIPLKMRRIATSLLWSPNITENTILRNDWEEIIEMIVLGKIDKIASYHGTFLKIKIKAANNKILTKAISDKGKIILTLPRGFYLKKSFTKIIISNHHY
ncbi:DNA mismatch repair endonuclease MutH [Candidatus Pantoea edessiphila]|uniref:DNA mismatch repair protein MutH n=1 Tax=Candidatus Pantoea edessiphila TaxID=2044610 RepID=A0A2P5T1H8_9GAMM|nr:DNA mismatch repair endonuclease MutH [Candidatus Pantoea edessiphila]PPI88449.1 DNA mismatch repair endonuclease MutH [Candidatus Pantoea edessiphila]